MPPLPVPPYRPDPVSAASGVRVGMCVPSMASHTTDEGWQLFRGLTEGGYWLCGRELGAGTNVGRIVDTYNPTTVVLQDKREWTGRTAGRGFDSAEAFVGVAALKDRADVFKLTVLKDAQSDGEFHRDAADEVGAHAWVVYYEPGRVVELAPFVRREHLVRTYHTVDRDAVPPFSAGGRKACLLSGATSAAYPLRKALFARPGPDWTILRHPGYGRARCWTPDYLRLLARHKVAVCTASRYGYLLRKVVEATACGCVVVTDLPRSDDLPGVGGNLVRVRPDARPSEVVGLVAALVSGYDPARQEHFAAEAVRLYDFRAEGVRLAGEIETLRQSYDG